MRASLTVVGIVVATLFAVGCGQMSSPTVPTSMSSASSSLTSSVGGGTVRALSMTGIPATVFRVSYPGGTSLEVFVLVPHGIFDAVADGRNQFGVHVAATYESNVGTSETVDSGQVPLRSFQVTF